jgi:hypothetical protein
MGGDYITFFQHFASLFKENTIHFPNDVVLKWKCEYDTKEKYI